MTCEQIDQQLDAYLDGTLDATSRTVVDAHLASCATCQAQSRELRAVLAAAERLPRSIAPPRNLWPAISSRLPARVGSPAATRPVWRRWAPLAAAAVLLIAVTAIVTYRIARDPMSLANQPAPTATLPVSFAADREYTLAAEDLERVLDEGRGRLAPGTIEVIERNLALIDAAISEARAALAADPANTDLRALLWGAHRQKLNLLDRATRLTRS